MYHDAVAVRNRSAVWFDTTPAEFAADLSKLPPEVGRRELLGSKWKLETELDHPVPYVSYPNGKGDVLTWRIAREVGYNMGFMEEWQPARDSPDMLSPGRYIQTQLRLPTPASSPSATPTCCRGSSSARWGCGILNAWPSCPSSWI